MPEKTDLRRPFSTNGADSRALVRPSPESYRPLTDLGPDPPQAGATFTQRLWVIRRNIVPIAAFVAICTIASIVWSYRLTPIYEASATLDVDRRVPTGIVGQEAANSFIDDSDQFLNTQVRLMQSNAVLAPVVHQFGGTSAGFPSVTVSRPINTFLIQINCQSPNPKLAMDVANALAKSYIEQSYTLRYHATLSLSTFMEKQIEELRAKMERSSEALAQFEKDLGMIRPDETNGIISARLLQLNTEYTTAQADRIKKQSAYQSLKSGDMAAAQVSAQGDVLRGLMTRVADANEKFKAAERQYGKSHPEYQKAAGQVKLLSDELEQTRADVTRRAESEYKEATDREKILQEAVTETKADFDRVNTRAFQYENLKREAETDRKFYEELANKIKEAGINAGFQDSSVRLADPAQLPGGPVYPNIPRNVQMAFLGSLLIAVSAAFGIDAIDATIRSPDDVEKALGAHSLGVLPLVKDWGGGVLSEARNGSNGASSNGHHKGVPDGYDDAIRRLRNSILLGALDSPLRTIMVTSASPAEGKTTTAAHLAITHAQQKRKTLLIDCDLRRPGVRRVLGMENGVGLSHVLSAKSSWQENISVMPGIPYLDVLLAGNASRHYADVIGWSLPQILMEAAPHYDLIIVDSPPILGLPEPLQLATAVDGVVLIALAGKTNRKAVSSVLSTLQRLQVNLIGIVLNEVTNKSTHDYYNYGYSSKYAYKSADEETEKNG